MSLLNKYLIEKIEVLTKENIKLNVIGEIEKLPSKTFKLIKDTIEKTKNNSKLVLTLAINYGARNEIINGIKK